MKRSGIFLLVAVLTCGVALAGPDERVLTIDPDSRSGASPLPQVGPAAPRIVDGRTSVIVYFEPGVGRQAPERAGAKAFAVDRGGFTRYEYGSVLPDAVNLRNFPVDAIEGLRNLPGVAKVEYDLYHPNLVRLDESTPLIRGLDTQLSAAGHGATGAGVRVCVGDTGIDMDHLMYADRIDASASYDFYNNDSNPNDDHGHGSHVAGIAVGGAGLSVDFGCDGSEPFQGVAFEATLIGAKILNQFGGGYDSDIIAGIDHCADQSASGGRADVINLSIGTGNDSTGACTHSWAVAANNAVANGVVVVAASGNENNSNSMGSPACGADVIAVGATYKTSYPNCENSTSNFNWGSCVDSSPAQDQVVCFSNESDHLDVVAPGSVIWSASNSAGGSSITGQSGTSMASPMVAGLAALILDADGSLTPAQVRQLIRDGAIDMGPVGFDRAYGYGRIDVIDTLDLVTPCGNNADCDDGLFCNGAETCNGGSCQAGSDPCPGQGCDEGTDSCFPLVCDADLVCESGEDCNNCASDCPSGSGASCGNGVCEIADGENCQSCPSDCSGVTGGRPSNRYCCGSDTFCGDPRCSSGGNICTETPGVGSCCGDGTCEGSEDANNCAIDCLVTCSTNADCSDGVTCTVDICETDGSCTNTPDNGQCPDDGQFCNGTEFCDGSADCSSTGDPCGSGEICNEATDTCDQQTCGLRNDPCSSGADCCSGSCKSNGRCR